MIQKSNSLISYFLAISVKINENSHSILTNIKLINRYNKIPKRIYYSNLLNGLICNLPIDERDFSAEPQ